MKTSFITIQRQLLYLFLSISVIIIIGGAIVVYTKNLAELELIRKSELNKVSVRLANIEEELNFVIGDLKILAALFQHEKVWEENGVPQKMVSSEKYALKLSGIRQTYDQIRYIDHSGMERLRVNHNHGTPEAVSKQKMQDKKDRYYFNNSIGLGKGKIYISPLDLNVENGKIVQPLNPMIRLATPIFDDKGMSQGIVIVNYKASRILQQKLDNEFEDSKAQLMLINQDSYWLKANSKEMEWGFMFEDRSDVKFSNFYHEEWNIIKEMDHSQIETKNGLFTFRTVYPLKSKNMDEWGGNENYHWKIVSHIPYKALYAKANERYLIAAIYILSLILINFSLSYKLIKNNILRKQAERQVKIHASKLLDMNVAKDKLFSIIGHDLRGPVGSALGISEFLLDEIKEKGLHSISEHAIMINNSLSNINELINNLLYWARSQSKGMIFQPETHSFYQLVKEIKELLSYQANAKKISLELKIDEELEVFADVEMLKTVMRNLLSNAIKFSNENDTVIISAVNKERSISIQVQDFGVGMGAEEVENIFSPRNMESKFGTKGEKGTGLGLILCKEFIEKHQGEFSVESEQGKGSVFSFTLPK